MPQTTEAACLLQSGAMYPSRVGLRTERGEDLFFGIKSGGFSLYQGDEPIYHFDLEGRWQRAFIEGVHYLKSLDTTVQSVDRDREGRNMILRRRTLDSTEVGDLDQRIREAIATWRDAIDQGRVEWIAPPPKARSIELPELRNYLNRVMGWDRLAWADHRDCYDRTYGPWPFLPPDCPNPIVVQAIVGRVFGDRGPVVDQIGTIDDFRQHVRDVAQLLGQRARQSNRVFLAGLDVFRRPVDRVVQELESIALHFGEVMDQADFVHAFLDDFRPPLPDRDGWQTLKNQGLGRVTLGIESGDPEIRAMFQKTWKNQDLIETVAHLRAAGIGLGGVVLVGVGGPTRSENHFQETWRLLDSLMMDGRELITIVDVQSQHGVSEEAEKMKRTLVFARDSKPPRVVAYNPDKQWA